MITLDASLVIAHLDPRDMHHKAATDYLRDSAGELLLIHSLNLADVLVGGARAGRAQEMLSDLHAIGIQVADRIEGEPLRLAQLRVECGLKLPDCCALDTALAFESTLATFDEALAEAARTRHVTVAPDAHSLTEQINASLEHVGEAGESNTDAVEVAHGRLLGLDDEW